MMKIQKEYINRNNVIEIGFYIGLLIKAANALVEFFGGILMLVLNHEWLNRLILLIAIPELKEDPSDFIVNYFIDFGKTISLNSQHSIAIYMLIHGLVKLTVIVLLVKKKLWAYPIAVGVFGIFIAFETYSYFNSKSYLLLIVIAIDIIITIMIILEYIRLRGK